MCDREVSVQNYDCVVANISEVLVTLSFYKYIAGINNCFML